MRVSCLYLSLLLLSVNGQRVKTRNEKPPAEQPHNVNNGVTEPGWKCVIRVDAVARWKSINWNQFLHMKMVQFQCTWIIEGPTGSKIALNLQKVNFKAVNQNTHCGRDFLQIIDDGKDRGRYCKQSQVTDYISIANKIRVDVQGEYQIPHFLRAQKEPFVLKYQAVKSANSGITKDAKAGSRPFVIKGNVVKVHPYSTPKPDNKVNSEVWNIGKFVIIIAFSLIFLILVLFFVRRRYCLGTKKEDSDEEESFDDFHQKEKQPPVGAKTRELPVGSLHIQDETARGTTQESRKQKKVGEERDKSQKVSLSSSREIPVAATTQEVARSEHNKKKKSSSTKKKRKKLSPEEEEQRKKDKMRMRRRRQRKKEKQERRQSERSDVDRLPSRSAKSKTKTAPAREEKERPKTERKRRKSTKEDSSSKRKHKSSDSKRKSSTSDRKGGDHRKNTTTTTTTTKRKSSSPKKSKSPTLAVAVPSSENKPKKKRSKRAEIFPRP